MANLSYDISIVDKIKPCLEALEETKKSYIAAVQSCKEVAAETGANNLIQSTEAWAEALPLLEASFNEAQETVLALSNYYKKLGEAVGNL